MSNTITIDLDSLSEERAQKMAGFILAYAGLDNAQSVDEPHPTQIAVSEPHPTQIAVSEPHPTQIAVSEPLPSEVFKVDPPAPISTAGPVLMIPNPPAPAPNSITTTDIIVDKTGLPWDSRIHSAAKSFNADGTWRARRGLADGYSNQIERELRQVMAIPSPLGTTTASGAPASTPFVASAPIAVASSSAGSIPLPPATASPAIQPYLDLMNKVSSALAGARITQPQLQKVCEAVGLPNFVLLGTRLDLVPTVAPMIDGILAGAAV